jgi:hypothetical protein
VHVTEAPVAQAAPRAEVVEMAEISAADFIQRKPIEEDREPTGTALRRRFAESAPDPVEAPERKGFLQRLFNRAPPLEEAA